MARGEDFEKSPAPNQPNSSNRQMVPTNAQEFRGWILAPGTLPSVRIRSRDHGIGPRSTVAFRPSFLLADNKIREFVISKKARVK